MSRLDSFIRRLEAQRQCLGEAARLAADLPGIVLELGLGNGRTFDHLRTLCPDREIYVFDRQVAAHPDCIPAPDRLFLGDFDATLPAALQRLGRGRAALVHVDLGSGDAAASRALAAAIAPAVAELMASGAVLVSDQEMAASGLGPLPVPPGVERGRYFMAVRA
ncbi:S-adenosylmethionine-dependent methyltransferase [Dongia mobilis]|uniref:S-adenosylmethionine-dependent methyltransferase n=1 Tax=Dongia mobilis TaxID=578943 RepID=A0A4R6WIR8_9PROT|nr:class I SAM-dependent methyltransferase [Dongia mobilis]TDQ78539.1 S-adenosylmethionine-dependent methyltransferase [Dongia mobilis]